MYGHVRAWRHIRHDEGRHDAGGYRQAREEEGRVVALPSLRWQRDEQMQGGSGVARNGFSGGWSSSSLDPTGGEGGRETCVQGAGEGHRHSPHVPAPSGVLMEMVHGKTALENL